jgi:hypothetical protein
MALREAIGQLLTSALGEISTWFWAQIFSYLFGLWSAKRYCGASAGTTRFDPLWRS